MWRRSIWTTRPPPPADAGQGCSLTLIRTPPDRFQPIAAADGIHRGFRLDRCFGVVNHFAAQDGDLLRLARSGARALPAGLRQSPGGQNWLMCWSRRLWGRILGGTSAVDPIVACPDGT